MIRFINKFEKRNVTDFLSYKNKTNSRYKESFEYVYKYLTSNPLNKDLNECEYYETKNYNYYLIEDNDVSVIIRAYRTHFTLFMKHKNVEEFKSKEGKIIHYDRTNYSIATFYVDTDKRNNEDYDDNFLELNKALPQLFEIIRKDAVHTIWNSLCFEVDKSVKVKCILYGDEILTIDNYIFALEELFRLHFEMFCENEVVVKLNDFKIGDTFGSNGVIKEVRTDDVYTRDTYYHGIGLLITKEDGKDEFKDVYSLARWYYDDVYGKQKIVRRRKFNIEHKGKTFGISYDEGWMFLFNKHEINGKIIYSSTEDIEIVKELLKVDFLDTEVVKIEEEVIKKD